MDRAIVLSGEEKGWRAPKQEPADLWELPCPHGVGSSPTVCLFCPGSNLSFKGLE